MNISSLFAYVAGDIFRLNCKFFNSMQRSRFNLILWWKLRTDITLLLLRFRFAFGLLSFCLHYWIVFIYKIQEMSQCEVVFLIHFWVLEQIHRNSSYLHIIWLNTKCTVLKYYVTAMKEQASKLIQNHKANAPKIHIFCSKSFNQFRRHWIYLTIKQVSI